MKKRKIKADVYTYSAAISACEKGKQLEKALELFNRMERDRVHPNTITFNSIISACAKAGEYFKVFLKHRIKVDVYRLTFFFVEQAKK